MSDHSHDPWLPEHVWITEPSSNGLRVTSVYDTDLGCLVEITTPDGHHVYGFDPTRTPKTSEH